MKKLNFLIAIVDYMWIMSIIIYPLLIILSVIFIIDKDAIDIPFRISGSIISTETVWGKTALLISVANLSLLFIALFKFKKLLANFKQLLIFEIETALLLKKIGQLVIYYAVICLIAEIISRTAWNNVSIEIGYSPFLMLLSLGLFLIVLSEVFKIGKRIKEENELTI